MVISSALACKLTWIIRTWLVSKGACFIVFMIRLGATVTILQRKCVSSDPHQCFVVEALVRKVPDDQLVSANLYYKLLKLSTCIKSCIPLGFVN